MPLLHHPSILRRITAGLLVILLFVAGWGTTYATPFLKMTEGTTVPRLPSRMEGWQQMNATNLPPARRDAALGYDPTRHRVILFGGRNQTGALDDTWAFDLKSQQWQQLATGGEVRPDARYSMVFGVDRLNNRFLITTGQAPSGLFNDIWAFDLATDGWMEVAAQGELPDSRYGAAGGIAAAGDALWLSHGFTNEGRFDDTRRFDLATNRWHDESPATTRPLPRCLHAATLPSNQALLLFGGCASGFGPCPLNDTWLFEQTTATWSEIPTPAEVQARLFPALVTLGNGNDLLLFGGEAGTEQFGDTWLLDLESRQWNAVPVANGAPQARAGHTMIWIPASEGSADGAALLFGGQGDGIYFNDLWRFVPDSEASPRSLFLPALWKEQSSSEGLPPLLKY